MRNHKKLKKALLSYAKRNKNSEMQCKLVACLSRNDELCEKAVEPNNDRVSCIINAALMEQGHLNSFPLLITTLAFTQRYAIQIIIYELCIIKTICL